MRHSDSLQELEEIRLVKRKRLRCYAREGLIQIVDFVIIFHDFFEGGFALYLDRLNQELFKRENLNDASLGVMRSTKEIKD